MKRILFYITTYPNYGGIEKVTTILANHLINNGFQIDILSFYNKSPELIRYIDKRVKVWFTPDQSNYLSNINIKFVLDFIKKNNFDYIIYQDCYSDIHEIILNSDLNLSDKLIVVEHNTPNCFVLSYRNYWTNLSCYYPLNILRKLLYPIKIIRITSQQTLRHKVLLQKCSKYILLSKTFITELKDIVGSEDFSKVKVISNPLTIEFPTSFPGNKKKQVIFIGRLVEDKGVKYLLQIWQNIQDKCPDWNLKILGDGPLMDFLSMEIKKKNLKQVSLEGNQIDIIPYLEESSLLFMTSLFEGFPLVLNEAMSRGVVPIAFHSFASLTEILNEENGKIIEAFNINSFSTVAINLMKDKQYRDRLALSAFNSVDKYSIEVIGRSWISLLS